MSDVLRTALAETQPVFKDKSFSDMQKQMIFLMNKSSNNLNQVARGINTLLKSRILSEQRYDHYLRLLDTIEFQLHFIIDNFDDN